MDVVWAGETGADVEVHGPDNAEDVQSRASSVEARGRHLALFGGWRGCEWLQYKLLV